MAVESNSIPENVRVTTSVFLVAPSGEDFDIYDVALHDEKGQPWILMDADGFYFNEKGEPLDRDTLRHLVEVGALD